MNDHAGVELVVRGAEKRDAGRGIARLPEAARRELGVLSGDSVLIEGERTTVAKAWPARPGTPDGVVLIDADTRANADVRIDETVGIAPAAVSDADAVVLADPDSPVDTDLDSDVVREAARRALVDRPVSEGERVGIEALGATFTVARTNPEGPVQVTDGTAVSVSIGTDGATASPESGSQHGGVSYEDIGGLDDELDLVRETIELPLTEPELFARLGIEPPKGVLLHGPPGTGKTLIARAVANEVDATFVSVSGPEIMSKYKGESEERLREVFAEARESAPAVVFFDEIDSIAGEREDGGGVESRVVGQLLSLMDGLDARGDVIVVGATNRVDALDPALRRGGRFDREIEIGVPNEAGRREVIEVHTRNVPLAPDVDLDRLAARTHGFVGADLASLVKEAATTALRRSRHGGPATDALEVTREDVESALAAVEPSAMREYVAEQPTEGFEAVGGLSEAKATLERAVNWPLSFGPLFDAAGASPPTGVLLYGPPGTGKTLLARAVAAESGVNFIHVAGPELLDRYVGESERAVREVFERARQAAPTVLLFDEIDAIAGDRSAARGDSAVADRIVSQLLTAMDGVADHPSVVVLGATNRRDALDPALLRPGRLETHVEVPPPDEAARRAILEVHLRETPVSAEVDLDEVAARTDGYSGADLAAVCREAAVGAVRELAERHGPEDANDHADEVLAGPEQFEAALATVDPSLA